MRLVDAHTARCAGCRAFALDTVSRPQHGRGGLDPQRQLDMPRRIVRLATLADRAGTWGITRWLLAVVAVEILVFSLPALVLGDERDTSAHAARHLGAFTVAYAVGLLVVVLRPARARTMLPVAAVLTGALVVTAIVDLTERRVPLTGEAEHLPELVSVVLIWVLAVPPPRRLAPVVSPRRRNNVRHASWRSGRGAA